MFLKTLYILFCAVYLEDTGSQWSSCLHHAISNPQPVSVLEEGCNEGDVLGSAPRLKQTGSPVLRFPPNIIQDQVKSWGEKEVAGLIKAKAKWRHVDLVTAQHKAGERSLQTRGFLDSFSNSRKMQTSQMATGHDVRGAWCRGVTWVWALVCTRRNPGSDVRTEALILVPLDRFVLPSRDIPPQIITDTPQHFPFSVHRPSSLCLCDSRMRNQPTGVHRTPSHILFAEFEAPLRTQKLLSTHRSWELITRYLRLIQAWQTNYTVKNYMCHFSEQSVCVGEFLGKTGTSYGHIKSTTHWKLTSSPVLQAAASQVQQCSQPHSLLPGPWPAAVHYGSR